MREEPPRLQRRVNEQAMSLAHEWRMLGRAATAVALLTSPPLFLLLYGTYDWKLPGRCSGTFVGVIIFRGGVDVIAHKLIPSPALYGAEDTLKEQDVMSRRRLWYWRHKFKVWFWLGVILLIVLGGIAWFNDESMVDAVGTIGDDMPRAADPRPARSAAPSSSSSSSTS